MATGIPATELSDDDVRRDLAQLDRTRADIQRAGTADQRRTHRARADELRREAARRGLDAP